MLNFIRLLLHPLHFLPVLVTTSVLVHIPLLYEMAHMWKFFSPTINLEQRVSSNNHLCMDTKFSIVKADTVVYIYCGNGHSVGT